eukprot:6490748-Amphidinium_carterae.3
MEENQCYAIVKPPPHKSWIISWHSAHGARMVKNGKHYYIHSLVMNRFVNKVQISKSQINASLSKSAQQHAEDVARSFNIFDPETQPRFPARGTQASRSEAAPPISVAAPREPSTQMQSQVKEHHSDGLHFPEALGRARSENQTSHNPHNDQKGVTQYALGEGKKFILENGFINSVIQVDGEPTIKSNKNNKTTMSDLFN